MDLRWPILAGGAVAGAAAGAGAWFFGGGSDLVAPAALGLGVLTLSAVAAELVARNLEIAALRKELRGMKRVQNGFEAEISLAKEGMLAVHQALSEGGGSRQRLAAMEDEVAVLQKLVARLQAAAGGEEPPARPKIETPDLSVDEVLALVRAAVADGAVDLYMQPVVTLPQRHRRYYECFSRIPDHRGGLLPADAYVAAAEEAGLIAPIDNLLLFRAVQIVRRAVNQNAAVGFFCNVSGHTLKDAGFLEDFGDFLKENPELAPSLILEMAQADFDPSDAEITGFMERMSDLGVRFSMDRVEDLVVDAPELRRHGFAFLKARARLLLDDVGPNALTLKHDLAQAEIQLVVEKIEQERELIELLEHDIGLGQGYLFGEPKAPTVAAAAA